MINFTRTTPGLLVFLLLQQNLFAQSLPGVEDSPRTPPEPQASLIEVDEKSLPEDAEIEERLAGIFANLPNLEKVTVNVRDGVVILAGTVDDTEALERAEQLAGRVAGAVAVVNNVERDRTIGVRLKAAMGSIEQRFKELAGNAPLLLLALAVVGAAIFVARLAARAEWLIGRVSVNWFVRDLFRQFLQIAIVFCGVVIALKLLDATALLGSLVGALGIVGLALGFATRDTVENYIASLLLSLRQPFRREDYISVDGIEGKVLRLTPRATVLMSLEGNHLRIPNSKVYKATITNYTRNPLRRFDFVVGVDTGIDLNVPRNVAVKTLADIPGVLASPPPQCLVQALGDSSVILNVLGWIDQRESDYLKMRSEAQRRVKEAFDEAGIVMPEPIYNVNLRRPRTSGVRAPVPDGAPVTAPLPGSTGTQRDDAVEEQMRSERRQSKEEDLLSRSAPSE